MISAQLGKLSGQERRLVNRVTCIEILKPTFEQSEAFVKVGSKRTFITPKSYKESFAPKTVTVGWKNSGDTVIKTERRGHP